MSGRPTIESLEQRFQRYLNLFTLDKEACEQLGAAIQRDVQLCKESHSSSEKKGDMYFLDTCVQECATGNEEGVYYAVDFGGTNIRCVRVSLDGSGKYSVDSHAVDIHTIPTKQNLPKGLMDPKATATELFDAIASIVLTLMKKHNDHSSRKIFQVGFTFSFAMNQIAVNSAQALHMSKGFETGRETSDPVVAKGTDIVLLLNKAFERNQVPAEVVAALNDTTGTLMSGSYITAKNQPEALIGVIIGTGLNICYVDREASAYGYLGNIINTEVGAMREGLPRNIIDFEVDDADASQGHQLMEKMVSGLYIPEMCRRLILNVFRKRAPALTWVHWAMTTEACMAMAYERDLEVVREVLQVQLEWDVKQLTDQELYMIADLCRAVCKRSAGILAIAIATMAYFTGRLQPALGGVTVSVDGSVYTKNPGYQEDVSSFLRSFLPSDISDLIKFCIAHDGSGVGAAILAATPHVRSRAMRSFYPPEAIWRSSKSWTRLAAPC